jgi:(S)-citramalyl-CoA lyase
MEMMRAIQSMLFVPGSRPERFAKALASGADCVCIDLEDSVPAEGKTAARDSAIAALGDPRLAIRINGLTTRDGVADLLAIVEASSCPPLVFIPKVEAPSEIAIARGVIDNPLVGFVPLIETINGMDAAASIASERGVAMLMFGGGDLSVELGVDLAWEPLLHARSRLVMACAGAGIPALDVPWITMDDEAGLVEECLRAKAMGFAGKAAIHPAHISRIHSVFRPTRDEILEAEAAEAAFTASGGAVIKFNGKMLEAPVMRRYRQKLSLKEKIDA